MSEGSSKERIVIVGGGFAGTKCAKILSKKLDLKSNEIVLFNKENHLVFHPLLAEVVGASLNPEPVTVTLRKLLPNVICRTEEVHSIDLKRNVVIYESNNGAYCRLKYNYVVICCGSAVNMSTIPGMQDHAYPLKTVGDAIALRVHVIEQLEKAEVEENPKLKKELLSFIVIGGGFSGVEVAGEINDLVRNSIKFYKNINENEVKVTLIHGRDQILPEVNPSLRDFAMEKMKKAGVNFILNTRAKLVTNKGVYYSDDKMIEGNTVVATVGNAMPSIIERLDVKKEKGRIVNLPDMRIEGSSNAWAIGDCSNTINSYDGNPSPPTAQFAERQGRQTAENIIRIMKEEDTKPFSFNPVGVLCSIGGYNAVAEIKGVRISGIFAWLIWRGVYLFKLPRISKKLKVGIDWMWDIFFARDLSHTKIQQTDRVAKVHYDAGEYIFRQGEPSNSFYIIETGEVEVTRSHKPNTDEEIIAVLGKNDFFGEMSLLSGTNHSANVRAKIDIEILVMGKHVFEKTKTIKPFRNMIEETIKRRGLNIWQKLPLYYDILQHTRVCEILEPVETIIDGTQTFEDILEIFNNTSREFCCIVNDKKLKGIITRSDLFRAIELGATKTSKITEFMVNDPISIAECDSAPAAVATMKEHGIKRLFVVNNCIDKKLVGYIRAEKLLYISMKSL
ncbi:MAG: FAD-dependent oxidoreductase [Thermodesulfobacteriota bacterium]